MSWTEIEQRIRRLAWRLNDAAQDVQRLRDGIGSLQQQLLIVSGPTGRATCDATITGHVQTDVYSYDLAGVSVEAWYPDNTGTQIGATATTDGSGDYSISGEIPSGGVSATIYFTKSRFDDEIVSGYALSCGGNVQDAVMVAASGYTETFLCPDPFTNTLTLVDSVLGNFTLTNGGVSETWTGTNGLFGASFNASHAEPVIVSVADIATGSKGGNSLTSTIGCGPLAYASVTENTTNPPYPAGVVWTINDP